MRSKIEVKCEGFLRVTHALSLNDTFWVKPEESSLRWEDVSLYRNEFNRLISEAAFDGTISESDFSSTSPEFGTDGYYAKCWVREGEEICLYKSGSGLLTPEIRNDLMVLTNFHFSQHRTIRASQERLDALSCLVRQQVQAILTSTTAS